MCGALQRGGTGEAETRGYPSAQEGYVNAQHRSSWKDHFDDDTHHWKGLEGRNLYTVGRVKHGYQDPASFDRPHVYMNESKDVHGSPGRSMFSGKATREAAR